MADEKWKGKVGAEMKGVTADQVWSLLADFCNLQNCMPNIDKCIKVEGEDGKPGLVRHICHNTTANEEQPFSIDIEKKENGHCIAIDAGQEQPISVDVVDKENDHFVATDTDEKQPLSVEENVHLVAAKTDEEQSVSSNVVDKEIGTIWAEEKLVIIDETERFLSYELIDNNFGIKSYEAAFRVVEVEGEEGCRVEWSYVADPVEGMTFEHFEAPRNDLLQSMVAKIQAHFSASVAST